MRDALPRLVATKQLANTSSTADIAMAASASTESCDSISNSTCSTPLTPTFSAQGHARYPSSCSSLGSTPPNHDGLDMQSSASKLPELIEDPTERDEDYVMIADETSSSPCPCEDDDLDLQSRPLARLPFIRPSSSAEYDLADSYFDSDLTPPPSMKRQPSTDDSPFNNIASRFGERFPSLSSRFKHRKANSIFGQSSRSELPSRAPSSRSSSLTGSSSHAFDQQRQSGAMRSVSRSEVCASPAPSVPGNDIVRTEVEYEPIDREALSSTPLLPPLMTNPAVQDVPLQSPLQSPTVAEPGSTLGTPAGTPRLTGISSPPLSAKPSIASFQRSQPSNPVTPVDLSPTLSDKLDEWAIRLGHANFVIYPEPYLPDEFTSEACRKLFTDWELARCNFLKHQVKTAEHYGVRSKTYKLTEQKWETLDAQWKSNHDVVATQLARLSGDPAPTIREPAPLMKMPTINDPKSEGKFPKLGDEDIVGPMVQIAAQIQQRPARRPTFLRFLSELRVPNPLFGRKVTHAAS